MARYCFISSHPLPTLLERYPLFLTHSLRITHDVWRRIDDGLSAFWLHHFTTPWSCEYRDALWGHNRGCLEIHMEAVVERGKRPSSGKFGNALWGCNQARLGEYWVTVDAQRAGCCNSFHQLVNSQPCEYDNVPLPLSSQGELADSGWSYREARQELNLYSRVNL